MRDLTANHTARLLAAFDRALPHVPDELREQARQLRGERVDGREVWTRHGRQSMKRRDRPEHTLHYALADLAAADADIVTVVGHEGRFVIRDDMKMAQRLALQVIQGCATVDTDLDVIEGMVALMEDRANAAKRAQ